MRSDVLPTVEVTLRIPGCWRHPREIMERLPTGFYIKEDQLYLPDQTKLDIFLIPADKQFPDVFRTSLRSLATADELEIVDKYTINVGLAGPGGSLESALRMMHAGAAIIHAGGAGVFIDNSCLSHGAEDWLGMTDEGSSDAISFGFVGIVRGKTHVWTTGMHVPGFPEIVMTRADADSDDRTIIEMIRYLCASERPVEDGHIIADENGPRFQIQHEYPDQSSSPTPMRNPFGRLRLVSFKDIAEQN